MRIMRRCLPDRSWVCWSRTLRTLPSEGHLRVGLATMDKQTLTMKRLCCCTPLLDRPF
jgi:hypothetical protein